jgi:hypothetical protein
LTPVPAPAAAPAALPPPLPAPVELLLALPLLLLIRAPAVARRRRWRLLLLLLWLPLRGLLPQRLIQLLCILARVLQRQAGQRCPWPRLGVRAKHVTLAAAPVPAAAAAASERLDDVPQPLHDCVRQLAALRCQVL